MESTNLCGYIAIFKGRQIEIFAESQYAAQLQAAKVFKAKKSYEVSVYLCQDRDGREVLQSTC